MCTAEIINATENQGIGARKPKCTAKLKDIYTAKDITIGPVRSIWIGRKSTAPMMNLRSAKPLDPGGSSSPLAFERYPRIILLYVSFVNMEKMKATTVKNMKDHSTHLQFFLESTYEPITGFD